MAVGDFKIKNPNGLLFAENRLIASGVAASINNGEPIKEGTGGNVVIMVDGDGTTSQNFAGIAKTVSTDTASAAGAVLAWRPLPNITYAGQPKTATNANTQALIDALMYKRVVFDLTGTAWTIDTGASNAATNGVIIVGGDFRTSTVYFAIGVNITKWGNPTTA